MSGSYAEEFGSGGPSDDGVGMGVWRAFTRHDGAREAFVEAEREKRASVVLTALLAHLSGPAGGSVT